MVFGKAFVWRANRANEPGAQVGRAADPIVRLLRDRVVEQAVDREVAARGIRLRIGKPDRFRTPAILVIRLGTKGGDLKLFVAREHDDDAEFAPDRNGLGKERFDFFGPSRGGDVVIARFAAQQKIAHATADPERGVPGTLERADEVGGKLVGGGHVRLTIYGLKPGLRNSQVRRNSAAVFALRKPAARARPP